MITDPLPGTPITDHAPWPRTTVTESEWTATAARLAAGSLTLLGLWGEPGHIHIAVADAGRAKPHRRGHAALRIWPLSLHRPRPMRPRSGWNARRVIYTGWSPSGCQTRGPWLDHGRWDGGAGGTYDFLPVEGEHIHQVPVGPVHAGIIEPGHFRFSADGETIVRLEARLGYTHKGLEPLMRGADLPRAARLAGRYSGDSTVAYALAFCRAAEAAQQWTPPARAVWLRAIMAELERLANHLGDVGAICNDAAFPILLAHCAVLREGVLREAKASFGHRLMMDCIIPGGVRVDLDGAGAARIAALVATTRTRLAPLVALYESTASLQDRTVGTGVLRPDLAQQFGAGGYVGRASGRRCDARRWPGYPPYDALDFEIPTRPNGDVDARLWIRVHEIEQSIRLIQQVLARLPDGPIHRAQAAHPSEGMALVEGFRGDILAWVRIAADGHVAHCHMRRSIMVPMAAAGSGDLRQYHRRLPPLQ